MLIYILLVPLSASGTLIHSHSLKEKLHHSMPPTISTTWRTYRKIEKNSPTMKSENTGNQSKNIQSIDLYVNTIILFCLFQQKLAPILSSKTIWDNIKHISYSNFIENTSNSDTLLWLVQFRMWTWRKWHPIETSSNTVAILYAFGRLSEVKMSSSISFKVFSLNGIDGLDVLN